MGAGRPARLHPREGRPSRAQRPPPPSAERCHASVDGRDCSRRIFGAREASLRCREDGGTGASGRDGAAIGMPVGPARDSCLRVECCPQDFGGGPPKDCHLICAFSSHGGGCTPFARPGRWGENAQRLRDFTRVSEGIWRLTGGHDACLGRAIARERAFVPRSRSGPTGRMTRTGSRGRSLRVRARWRGRSWGGAGRAERGALGGARTDRGARATSLRMVGTASPSAPRRCGGVVRPSGERRRDPAAVASRKRLVITDTSSPFPGGCVPAMMAGTRPTGPVPA